jgi:hypothetical protein
METRVRVIGSNQEGWLCNITAEEWEIFLVDSGIFLKTNPDNLRFVSLVREMPQEDQSKIWNAMRITGKIIEPIDANGVLTDDLIALMESYRSEVYQEQVLKNPLLQELSSKYNNILPSSISEQVAAALTDGAQILVATGPAIHPPAQIAQPAQAPQQMATRVRPVDLMLPDDALGSAIINTVARPNKPASPYNGMRCYWIEEPRPGVSRPFPMYTVKVLLPGDHPDNAGPEIWRRYFEPDLIFEV